MSVLASRTREPIPLAPLALGLSGLLPFLALALGVALGGVGGVSSATLALALAAYGAVIVSFLGGIRWGVAVAAPAQPRVAVHYALSVLPSLAAWALLAAPEPWRLAGLGLLALGLGPIDRGLVTAGLAPPWFARLRLILSGGAGVALLFAAVFARGL